jgi:hypothetical protein
LLLADAQTTVNLLASPPFLSQALAGVSLPQRQLSRPTSSARNRVDERGDEDERALKDVLIGLR